MVTRGSYGEITTASVCKLGQDVINLAVKTNKLPAAYFDRISKKNAECLNYDIYDKLDNTWLIQRRDTTIDKYGVHPVKSYYTIRRCGQGVVIKNEPRKSMANLAAKNAANLGDAIKVLNGKFKIPTKKSICYKSVAIVNGQLQSIYSRDTIYTIGKKLIQKARANHNGGYYVYESVEKARKADVPLRSDNIAAPRVIIECECSGTAIQYDNGKISYTTVLPLRVLKDTTNE